MNKTLIYQYISELENELLGSVLSYNKFSQLIVSEIINKSIIQLHELKGGLLTDEKTAKDLISTNIRSFYSPAHLVKVEDKFRNWDNRVCYGSRGRMLLSTRDLVEFRMVTDTNIKRVEEEKDAMLLAVRNFSFKSKPAKNRNVILPFVMIIIGVLFVALASIGIYSYSISNRYQRINADTVFDNWNGKSIYVYDVPDNDETTYSE